MLPKFPMMAFMLGAAMSVSALLGVPAEQQSGDQHIEQLLEPIRQAHHLPAMAGALVTGKGLSAVGVTGVRKSGTDVAASPTDEWHLGSDTKAMTAVILATLIERGKVKWKTTIGEVFPALTANAAPEFRGITLLQLLSHHAGLPANIDWHGVARSSPSLRAQRLAAVKTAASTALLSAPGSTYAYSNLGYVIAGTMAEQITDTPWENLMREIVFKPLGMTSAGFGGTGTRGKVDQPWPHTANGQPMPTNGPAVDNPEVMGPAGTVHCTLSDWAKFIADQLRGSRGTGALLKPETYKTLRTTPFGGDYALGWLVAERPWGGGTVYTHAGSNTMNYAVVWMAPERDFAVLVATNQAGPEAEKATDEAASALIRWHQTATIR